MTIHIHTYVQIFAQAVPYKGKCWKLVNVETRHRLTLRENIYVCVHRT